MTDQEKNRYIDIKKAIQTDAQGKKWIIGEQLIFRPMTEADADLIIHWRNQDHVRRNFIYQEPFTRESHQHWVRTMIDTGKAVQFMMCEKEADGQAGKPVGSAYLRDIDDYLAKAEYGMFIGEQAVRSRGYGTEAILYVLEYAFYVLKLHKVMSRVLADNIASLKSCEKAGYAREGYLKEEVKLGGIYHDLVLLGKVNPAD